jgi:sulfite exporter TauE/SafE
LVATQKKIVPEYFPSGSTCLGICGGIKSPVARYEHQKVTNKAFTRRLLDEKC